jgi:hypothetical protein
MKKWKDLKSYDPQPGGRIIKTPQPDKAVDFETQCFNKPAANAVPWWTYVGNDSGSWCNGIANKALIAQSLQCGYTLLSKFRGGQLIEDKGAVEAVHKAFLDLGLQCFQYKNNNQCYCNPTTFVDFEHTKNRADVFVQTTDPELFLKLCEIQTKYINNEPDPEGKVFVLLPTAHGLNAQSIGVGAIPLIRDNYREEVLSGYDKVVKDLQAENPLGRLSIFDGCPGTGKTYLIRALLSDLPHLKFMILPSNMMSSLTGPDLLAALVDASDSNDDNNEAFLKKLDSGEDVTSESTKPGRKKPLILIIEDADSCLAARSSDNVSSISSALNLSDGIIGNLLDLRIVATTNIELDEIDPAIMRPGRLSQRIEVGKLDPKQAEDVYKRLGGKEEIDWKEKKFVPLSDVYSLAKGGSGGDEGATKTNKRKVGFAL